MSDGEKKPRETKQYHITHEGDLSQAKPLGVHEDIDTRIAPMPGSLAGITKEHSAWDVYNNEAKKVDTELVNDWRDSLNSLFLFAAIFAAVLTAFIIESKRMLEQDPTEVMVDVMIFYTNNAANGTHRPYTRPIFEASSTAVTINSLFFASLSSSLVAALASVVALQWVADYDAAITRGGSSPEDRAKRRQFRYAGIMRWRMGEIIMALPLILYASAILFFGGLILWMWVVHQTVGLVVVGGTALAVLFYAVSTLLSVVFVSAPFRTPLGRWIYSLGHILSTFAHQVKLAFNRSELKTRRFKYRASRRREDIEVDKRNEIGIDSLIWLAHQLSISQDSYERLLLLASELPKLKQEISTFSRFAEAPWYSIFDLLGWRYLKNQPDVAIDRQEMRVFGLLADCYRIPEVQAIISPAHPIKYVQDAQTDEYWTQYCDISDGQWSRRATSLRPNASFLLLRDIPLPSKKSASDLELTIRLSRWRNSVDNASSRSNGRFRRPSPRSFSGSLAVIDQLSKESQLPLWLCHDDKLLYDICMDRITQVLFSSGGTISLGFLDSLRWGFERRIREDEIDSGTISCLSRPLLYRDALHKRSGDSSVLFLHHAFTLLLARNLRYCSATERVRRVKEVITMVWLAPVYHGDVDVESMDQHEGMETFFDANAEILMGWITNSDEVPRIQEILHHLSVAQAEQPEIGSLWRVKTAKAGSDPHLIEALFAFDYIMKEDGITSTQHHALVDLICRDFEMGPLEAFRGSFPEGWLETLRLQDACLQVLAMYIGGSGSERLSLPVLQIEESRKDSWARISAHLMKNHEGTHLPAVLQLQAAMWPVISDQQTLCTRALEEPRILTQLRRMFEHPIPCSEHYDGEGHLLLHLFNTAPTTMFNVDMSSLTTVPLKGRYLAVLPMFLIMSEGREAFLSELQVDPKCQLAILQVCDDVAASQFAMLGLLRDIVFQVANFRGLATEDVELVTICINKALRLASDNRVTHIIPQLISRLEVLRRRMVGRWSTRSVDEKNLASDNAIKTMGALRTHMSTIAVLGRNNCRLLACARGDKQACAPARSWLSVHID